jgi:hypothetical protein
LFWKEELKLDDSQCQRIREINSEYYEKLSSVVETEPNHNKVREIAEETLVHRSEGIWETFYPKQRKRWKKMFHEKNEI